MRDRLSDHAEKVVSGTSAGAERKRAKQDIMGSTSGAVEPGMYCQYPTLRVLFTSANPLGSALQRRLRAIFPGSHVGLTLSLVSSNHRPMSKLQEILVRAKMDLAPWESIPRDRWEGIAAECGPDEVTEIHERMGALRSELDTVESWDGDTRDDIHRALEFFAGLLALKQGASGHSPA